MPKCRFCLLEVNRSEREWKCPFCGRPLLFTYDPSLLIEAFKTKKPNITSMEHYRNLLPLKDVPLISLGEGNTPLLSATRLAKSLEIEKLSVKYEGSNPSGTFKDRCAAISLSLAKFWGANGVAIGSAGNAGAAAAFYAAKAGLKCFVFVPAYTSKDRLAPLYALGAEVILVNGSVNDCIEVITKLTEGFGWHHVSTAATHHPYQTEGPKTIAFEIAESCQEQLPDVVITPVGGGGLLGAIGRGFTELLNAGLIKRIPRLVGAQTQGCSPFVRMVPGAVGALAKDNCKTIAVSILDPIPLDGELALEAILSSNGTAVAVSDEEILTARSLLAREEGIFAEPASSAPLAAGIKLLKQGWIKPNEHVAVVVTGSGLKDLNSVMGSMSELPIFEKDIKAITKTIESRLAN